MLGVLSDRLGAGCLVGADMRAVESVCALDTRLMSCVRKADTMALWLSVTPPVSTDVGHHRVRECTCSVFGDQPDHLTRATHTAVHVATMDVTPHVGAYAICGCFTRET